jgi:hypothetical protein
MHVSLLRSRVPALVAAGYGLIFTLAVYFDLVTGGTEPWETLVFLMSFPWSMLLMFVAAWTLAHIGYPLDYFFIPCGLLNMIAVFLIARSAMQRPGAMRIDGSQKSKDKR